jgi:hypothetical protein
MAKKVSAQGNKVTNAKRGDSLESEKKFKEVNLSTIGSGIDIAQALKKSESAKKIKLGNVYFPNEQTAEGEFVEGVYLGTVDFEKEVEGKKEYFKGVVLAPSPKERVVCISEKAVERLAAIAPGTKAEITYLGDIRTGSGFVMRNISVSIFE